MPLPEHLKQWNMEKMTVADLQRVLALLGGQQPQTQYTKQHKEKKVNKTELILKIFPLWEKWTKAAHFYYEA
jgi:hypothetical protein